MKTVWLVFVMLFGSVFAGPVPVGTKSEVQKAKGVIDDLVESGVDAEKLVSMAAETEKGSERFWLYSNAFILQTKDGKYAEATETLKALQQNVTDIPEINIINLIERNVGKKIAEAPELAAILKESKTRLAAQRLVVKLKQDIRKKPKDVALKASLGEALAVCGDWKAALETFAEAKGKIAGVANAELQGKRTMGIAAFWWDYKPCRELASSVAFRAHAADIYTELLKGDQLSVVEKTLAESRAAQLSDAISDGAFGVNSSACSDEKTGETRSEIADSGNDAPLFEVDLVPCGKVPEWKYEQNQQGGDRWTKVDFDDSRWSVGRASFGNRFDDTTSWTAPNICMRKRFDCPYNESDIKYLQVKASIDDDLDVWLNGVHIYNWGRRWHRCYETCVVPQAAWKGLLRKKNNVLAVMAKNFGGAGFADVGLVVMVRRSIKSELCCSEDYLPVGDKLLFPNAKLDEINACSAVLAGRWVNWNRGTALFAQNIKRVGDSRMTMQFQYVDNGALKGVGVELEQRGRDVWGRVKYGMVAGGKVGDDFEALNGNDVPVKDNYIEAVRSGFALREFTVYSSPVLKEKGKASGK